MPQVLLATPEMAAEYSNWFVNRRAYTRQSDRPHPESGRHFYYRPGSKAGAEVALELEDIRRHLAGAITLGIYAINPGNQRVKWMAIDADYRRSLDDLLKLQYELQQDGIQAALEQSRRGGHLWILFETPVLAKHARVYIRHLAGKLAVQVKSTGPSDGIELFPKQDRIDPGAIRQCDPRATRGASGSQPPLLVLRRRPRSRIATCIPARTATGDGSPVGNADRGSGDSRRRCAAPATARASR